MTSSIVIVQEGEAVSFDNTLNPCIHYYYQQKFVNPPLWKFLWYSLVRLYRGDNDSVADFFFMYFFIFYIFNQHSLISYRHPRLPKFLIDYMFSWRCKKRMYWLLIQSLLLFLRVWCVLKGLFNNNVSTFNNLSCHGPTCHRCLW